MIILSPSENGPLFKVKSKIQAPIQDNGEISTGRCHDGTLLSPVVMGREHDPAIVRISYFRKTIPINMRQCWVSRPLTYLDRPFSFHLRAKRDLMSCVYPAVSYRGTRGVKKRLEYGLWCPGIPQNPLLSLVLDINRKITLDFDSRERFKTFNYCFID
jgi:hypothetical protein